MDKLQMQSKNLVDENIEFIAKRFPNCVTEALDEEGKLTKLVDFDMLKQELSHIAIDGNIERYNMTWPEKKQAILNANSPIAKTLRPCREESVDFDHTQNLYIEGDNLDVLKLLRETYLGKIKMIYIDPPYNTGKDSFVYNDKTALSFDDYVNLSKLKDDNDNQLFDKDFRLNNESNGKFHTNWLNMMYPRLKLAKDLLTEDGAIFISIDDNEITNLRKICDEIFGTDNFIAQLIWKSKSGGANDSKFIAVDHEYVLLYCRDVMSFSTNNIAYDGDLEALYTGKDEYFEERGPYRPMLLQQKGLSFSKALTYEIEAPDGSKLVPEAGGAIWRWSKDKFLKAKENGFVEFKKVGDTYKIYTKQYMNVDYDGNRIERGKLLRSIIDDVDGRLGTRILQNYFDSKIFTNSKPVELIQLFLKVATNQHDIILDFFSGSATTAQAVMQLNAEDNGNRKYIMVQIPEVCDEKSEAYKAGYRNICEIGKERIRRAGKKIKEELVLRNLDNDLKLPFSKIANDDKEFRSNVLNVNEDKINNVSKNLDIGFRDLKLDSSCMKDIYYSPNKTTQDLLTQFEDNIKEDRTPEDLLFQVMLDMGVMLSSAIKTLEINGKKVFNVNDGDLVCCFDKNINDEVVTAIAKMQPLYAVFRDASMSTDSVAVNFDQIFETYSPTTTRKII